MARKRSETWVWLGWIVPIVSFWLPFQVVRAIVDAQDPARP
jgi:hypothetical protein